MKRVKRRIVFDIETYPFSKQFKQAKTSNERLRLAPKMRVACVYDESINKYSYYLPQTAKKLIATLKSADEVISFNGKNFDLLVLSCHYKLQGKVPKEGKHIDLHEIMSSEVGRLVSLDHAVRINFNEHKQVEGREMVNLDLPALKKACRSDVEQTYRLWKLYIERELKYPESRRGLIDVGPSPGDYMPRICSRCGSSVQFLPSNTENMSEGQLVEYESGLRGAACCPKCNVMFIWEV